MSALQKQREPVARHRDVPWAAPGVRAGCWKMSLFVTAFGLSNGSAVHLCGVFFLLQAILTPLRNL